MDKGILKLLLISATAVGISATSNAQFPVPAPPGLPQLEVRVSPDAPPAMRHEHRSARPDQMSVWVGGYWDRHGSQWGWMPGRWDRPEDHHAHWMKARYIHEYGAYRYEPGHWSNQKIVEGDEYRHWKSSQHGQNHHGHQDRDHDGENHNNHR